MKKVGSVLLIIMVIITFISLSGWIVMQQCTFAHDIALQRNRAIRNQSAVEALVLYAASYAKSIWNQKKYILPQTFNFPSWPKAKSSFSAIVELKNLSKQSVWLRARILEGGTLLSCAEGLVSKKAENYIIEDIHFVTT